MNIIPLVFCFDDSLELPAGVCLTSLLENANDNTFYEIFILHSDYNSFHLNRSLKQLENKYPNCRITFRSVGNSFKGAYEIRGITTAAYYRLLIPELIPEYDKIMYHDVDVIFRRDLAEVFLETDIDDFYMAGVIATESLDVEVRRKRERLGLDWLTYIQSGCIIINSKKLREDSIVNLFKNEVASSKYEYQDMDIINLVCKGKLKTMAPAFNVTVEVSQLAACHVQQPFYTQSELQIAQKIGTIHYNGAKPWREYCVNFDYWWEYYRKSIFYDPKFYFEFYFSKLNYLDELTLWKRIKVLARFFKTGGKIK